MVAVPISNTCRMCGALPARNAAIAAVIDSGYCPLKIATTLYSFWLALKPLASSFNLSLSAPCIECHHWISVWARAVADSWTAPAKSARPISVRMLPPCGFPDAGKVWRARRESNARPMASEAITLSPELRARGGRIIPVPRDRLRRDLIHLYAQLLDDLRPANHVLADDFGDSLRGAGKRLEARRFSRAAGYWPRCSRRPAPARRAGRRAPARSRGREYAPCPFPPRA